MNALLEARPSTAAAKSRLSVLTTFDSPDSPSATPHAYTLSSNTPASNGVSAAGMDAGSSMQQLVRPGTPGTPSRSSYAIVATELLAASSPQAPASPKVTRTDRSGLLNSPASSSSPTAAELLGATAGSFDRLLSGKVSRARSSLIATQPAGAMGTAGPAAATAVQELAGTMPSRSSTAHVIERAPPGLSAGAAGRVSLATVGLLAAPDAGLLPGSPLSDAAVSGVAAALFGSNSSSGNSSSGAARSSISSRPQAVATQQQQVGRVSVAAAAAQQTNGAAAVAAARQSLAGGMGQAVALLQITPAAQPGSSKAAAAAAAQAAYFARLRAAEPAAEHSSATDTSSSSGTAQSKQIGSAAFRTTSRDKANRVGRVTVPAADAPGPGHYRPQHGPTDKHVPAAHVVTAAGSRPHSASKSAQQQQQSGIAPQPLQQHRASTELPAAAVAAAAAAAGSLTLLATRGSATGTPWIHDVEATGTPRIHDVEATGTPRIHDVEAGMPLGLQPHRVHARPKPQKGTSSFKAVSREQLQRQQRPASAGAGAGAAAGGDAGGDTGAAVDYYREGYDSLTRPRSSRGPVSIFAKQVPRPLSAAMSECSSPAALGPGAYHRSGQLPISYTGADVPAGHLSSSAGGALEFDKYCSRPGSSAAAAVADADDGVGLLAGGLAAATDWPGLWGWAAAADGCPHQTGHLTDTFTCAAIDAAQQQDVLAEVQQQQQQQQQQGDGVQQKQRPSSRDALAYMRRQFPADLVDPQEEDAASCSPANAPRQQLWQQHQQLQLSWPKSGHQRLKQAGARARPTSAGAVLTRPRVAAAGNTCAGLSCLGTGSFTAAAAQRPQTAGPGGNSSSSNSRHGGMLGLQQVAGLGGMGFAPRVKGGRWSMNSRAAAARVMRAMSVGSVIPPASVAVLQPGTELAYDPNPEVLGHMHKTPVWSMPPNRTATSKKWAQAALKAGLQ